MELTFKSYAKINLALKVLGKASKGYHKIETVMQLVDLYDTMSFEKLDEDSIVVNSTNKELENEDNLAYKEASLLKSKFHVKFGVRINIEKIIPLASGLGGGSSNAATTLTALNKLWKLKIPEKKLIDLSTDLGSDTPFFITGSTALVYGIGDKLKPVKKSHKMNIVLINPGFKVYTKDAYKMIDKFKRSKRKPNSKSPPIQNLIKSMAQNDFEGIASNISNDFEEMLLKKYPIMSEIKSNMLRNRALNATVSGSGPTMFGIFESIYTAREAYYELRDIYPFVYLTKTL